MWPQKCVEGESIYGRERITAQSEIWGKGHVVLDLTRRHKSFNPAIVVQLSNRSEMSK